MTKKSKVKRDGMDVRKRLQAKVQQAKVGQVGGGEVELGSSRQPQKMFSSETGRNFIESNLSRPKNLLTAELIRAFKESELKRMKGKRKDNVRMYRQERIGRFESCFPDSFHIQTEFLGCLPNQEFISLMNAGIGNVRHAEKVSLFLQPCLRRMERSMADANKSFKIKAIALDELSKLSLSSLSNRNELIPNHAAFAQAKQNLEQLQSTMTALSTSCTKVMMQNERIQDRYADALGQRKRYEELVDIFSRQQKDLKAQGKVLTLKSIQFLESLKRLHKRREEKSLAKIMNVNTGIWNDTVRRYLPEYEDNCNRLQDLKETLSLNCKCLTEMKIESEKKASSLADVFNEILKTKNDAYKKITRSLKFKGAFKTRGDLEVKVKEWTKSLESLRKDLDVKYARLQKLKIESEFLQFNQESEADKEIPRIELTTTLEIIKAATNKVKHEVESLDAKVKSIDGMLLQEQLLLEHYMLNQDSKRKEAKFLEDRFAAEARQHEHLKMQLSEIHRFIAFKESLFHRQVQGISDPQAQTLFPVPPHLAMQSRFYV